MAIEGYIALPQFQPLTYEQYAKPFEDYAKVYYGLANQYDELNSKSGTLETILNNSVDTRVYNDIKKFNDAVRAETDNFLQYGLTPNNTRLQDFLKFRREFNTRFQPLAKLYEDRAKLINTQLQAKLQNNNTIFDIDYNTKDLYWMLEHPDNTFKTINLNEVTKDTRDMAKNFKTQLNDFSIIQDPKMPYHLLLKSKYGETTYDILDIYNINSPHYNSSDYRAMRDIVDRAMNKSGVTTWDDNNKIELVRNAAIEGLYDAIGSTHITPQLAHITPQLAQKRGSGGGDDKSIPLRSKLWITKAQSRIAEDNNAKGYQEQRKIIDEIIDLSNKLGIISQTTSDKEDYMGIAQLNSKLRSFIGSHPQDTKSGSGIGFPRGHELEDDLNASDDVLDERYNKKIKYHPTPYIGFRPYNDVDKKLDEISAYYEIIKKIKQLRKGQTDNVGNVTVPGFDILNEDDFKKNMDNLNILANRNRFEYNSLNGDIHLGSLISNYIPIMNQSNASIYTLTTNSDKPQAISGDYLNNKLTILRKYLNEGNIKISFSPFEDDEKIDNTRRNDLDKYGVFVDVSRSTKNKEDENLLGFYLPLQWFKDFTIPIKSTVKGSDQVNMVTLPQYLKMISDTYKKGKNYEDLVSLLNKLFIEIDKKRGQIVPHQPKTENEKALNFFDFSYFSKLVENNIDDNE